MTNHSIGDFIAAMRKANGMTQKELADRLHVSDKSVSRWERNETAPDLSLIPVLADIFNVSADELLRGERMGSAQSELSKKSQKQIDNILRRSMSAYQSATLFSLALAVVALIVMVVARFGFYAPLPGAGVAAIFLVGSLVLQGVALNRACIAVCVDEADETDTTAYRKRLVSTLFCVICVCTFVAVFLLAFFAEYLFDVYQISFVFFIGILPADWLGYLPVLFVCAILFCVTLSFILPRVFLKKSVLPESLRPAINRNARKKLICGCLLVAALFLTCVGYRLIENYYYNFKTICGPGQVFDTFEEFKAYAERPLTVDPNGIPVEIEHEDGTIRNYWEGDEKDWYPAVVFDAQSNAYPYMCRNMDITSINYDAQTFSDFVVYSQADQKKYNMAVETGIAVFLLLLFVEPLAAFLIYLKIREK